jgi:hypothetical protein
MTTPKSCICGDTLEPDCEAHRGTAVASSGGGPLYKSLRRRANIKSTSKGDLSFDCTIDGTGYSEAELLLQLYSLATKLQQTCHPAIVDETALAEQLEASITLEARCQPPEAE